MFLRWTIAFGLTAGLVIAVHLFERQLTPESVRDPACELSQFPRVLGSVGTSETFWKSSSDEDENDPRIFVAVGADTVCNRRYHNGRNESVSIHMAVFKSIGEWTPHLPTVCYEGAGWDIVSRQPMTLDIDSSSVQVMLFTAMYRGERHRVLYYYQRTPHSYHSSEEARKSHQALWGQKVWPPLVKVMLQTLEDDPKRADERLISIAKSCASWCDEDSLQDSSIQ